MSAPTGVINWIPMMVMVAYLRILARYLADVGGAVAG